MKVTKNGITKSISPSEWGKYQQQDWRKMGCSEPQPSQEGLYIVNEYTIAKKENK
jgi:hypothetical protein